MEKHSNRKQGKLARLTLHTWSSKEGNIARDTKGHFLAIKWLIQQKNIRILSLYLFNKKPTELKGEGEKSTVTAEAWTPLFEDPRSGPSSSYLETLTSKKASKKQTKPSWRVSCLSEIFAMSQQQMGWLQRNLGSRLSGGDHTIPLEGMRPLYGAG